MFSQHLKDFLHHFLKEIQSWIAIFDSENNYRSYYCLDMVDEDLWEMDQS